MISLELYQMMSIRNDYRWKSEISDIKPETRETSSSAIQNNASFIANTCLDFHLLESLQSMA